MPREGADKCFNCGSVARGKWWRVQPPPVCSEAVRQSLEDPVFVCHRCTAESVHGDPLVFVQGLIADAIEADTPTQQLKLF